MLPPLADRLRPHTLDEIAGQQHLVGDKGWLRKTVLAKRPLSILLFGPPGCGKTTLAKIYAASFDADFVSMSAIFSGVADIKKIVAEKEQNPLFRRQTILFIDEIHRFNKTQQDAFLPFVENGTIVLIGATTENPSFSLSNALLSRLRVLTLTALQPADLEMILNRYEKLIRPLQLETAARKYLLELTQGDGRYLLNMIENLEQHTGPIDVASIENVAQKKACTYDKNGEYHYNLISALHKSIRGSDPNAALYWLCRMFEGGEDRLFIIRRLIRMASEDIGLADPQALPIAISAQNAFTSLGSPEGELAIAQAVIYLALAPKSNATYLAYNEAKSCAAKTGSLEPPNHILNAPTALMKTMERAKGYIYDHDTKEGFSGQNYFPKELPPASFYNPAQRGFEREMEKRLLYFKKLKQTLENGN